MKVEGPGNLRGNASVQRTGKSGGTGGADFAKQLLGDTGATHGVTGVASVHAVGGVLALQEVDDAAARASRGKMRAQEMIDILEDIRHGMLAGALPAQKLVDLARVVQSRKVQVDDPKLAAILDEVDLRAQVELAKLQH
ncbi:MAG TPA: flagellar assembly protein FliX [Azospirillum sp.]|nr:flagellar assembly protein FliX [Azospirillum sp.]